MLAWYWFIKMIHWVFNPGSTPRVLVNFLRMFWVLCFEVQVQQRPRQVSIDNFHSLSNLTILLSPLTDYIPIVWLMDDWMLAFSHFQKSSPSLTFTTFFHECILLIVSDLSIVNWLFISRFSVFKLQVVTH